MPSRFIALLRGINVGKAKRIAMADLRALVAGLGYTDVSTLLNSGNVVFAAGADAAETPVAIDVRLEEAIAVQLGVASRVTVLSAAELEVIIGENPLDLTITTDASRLLVSVAADPAHLAKLQPLTNQEWGADQLAIGSRAAYIWCGGGILESKLAATVGKALGAGVTSRNWATMLKLRGMANG